MPRYKPKLDDLHECDIVVESETDDEEEGEAETEAESATTEQGPRAQKPMPPEGTVIVAASGCPELVCMPDPNRRYRLSKRLTKFLRYTSAGARLYADGSIWINNLAQVMQEDEAILVAIIKGDHGKHFDFLETSLGLRVRAKLKHAHTDVVEQLVKAPMEEEPTWKANEDYTESSKKQRNWEAKQRKKIRRDNDYVPVAPKKLRPPKTPIDEAEL